MVTDTRLTTSAERLSASLPWLIEVEYNPAGQPMVDDARKSLAGELDLAKVDPINLEEAFLVTLGQTKTFVMHQGEDIRREGLMLAPTNSNPWEDVVFTYQTDVAGEPIGWAAIAKPNTEKLQYETPFIANIVIRESMRRQGHGMRLASLLHRLSGAIWQLPLSPGPSSYLSRDGRGLTLAFEERGWLTKVPMDYGHSELVGNG
ncbi:MAG TPA: hypothetical protein VIH90_03745 [Candidatus Saccharimonadales bacterium]